VEGDIELLVGELCGDGLDDFFERYVYGRSELPLDEWLGALGIGLRLRPAKSASDEGSGSDVAPGAPPPRRPAFGAKLRGTPEGVALVHVLDGSPAQRAGLSGGDVVVAVDGIRATAEGLERLMARSPVGERVTVHAFRRNELMAFEVSAVPAPADTCDLWLLPADQLDPPRLAMRDAWLGPTDR
jgi:predicted metalloprotease with PDZ domain